SLPPRAPISTLLPYTTLFRSSLLSARRIRQPIDSEGDIRNAFDAITYNKGAAVIGMFEEWAGAEPFRKGVKRYLTEHADGNATRSEEHTSELQSRENLVCRLL